MAERAPLSRTVIVRTAISYVDEHGLSALTMRRLGTALGVEAMALYRYVNGREDLLEAIVDQLVGELRLDPDADQTPTDGWQAYLQWLAHAVRNLAHRHPHVFPLVATRHPAAPWLRPPLRSLDVVEDFLSALVSRGFGDDAAVTAYRAFTSFLLGHLLLEVAARGADTAPAEVPLDEGDASIPHADGESGLGSYQQVDRLQELLSQDHADAEFEKALEGMLDRLDLLLAQ